MDQIKTGILFLSFCDLIKNMKKYDFIKFFSERQQFFAHFGQYLKSITR